MRYTTPVLRGLLIAGVVVACAPPGGARSPTVPPREVRPACPRGPFATELDAVLPALAPVQSVSLIAAGSIDEKVEPGCVIPFRREPDDRLLDVGRVVGRIWSRSKKEKPKVVGRGRLELGRRAMRLRLHNDGGDAALSITLDGAHVVVQEKGAAAFEADVAFDATDALPLPLDALVAALDDCATDTRLGRTEDGNIIEARRGAVPLWRSRWMNAAQTSIVDTSFACSQSDARLMWRTAVGDLLPMIAVASVRSDRVLVLTRQGASETEDISDYGVR